MNENEKNVLRQLCLQPNFFDLEGVEVALFRSEHPRLIFKAIKKLSANGKHPDEILIATETGIESRVIFALMEGTHLASEENFKQYVQILRDSIDHKKLLKEILKQDSFYVKGIPVDNSKTIEIADKIKQRKETGKGRPKTVTFTEFLKRDLPKRQILIDPILGLQEMTMIHGRPKIGKSLLTLQLARCLITGEDWLGFKTNKTDRPILIIQDEMSDTLMQERVRNVFWDIEKDAITNKIILLEDSRGIRFDEKAGKERVLCSLEDIDPGVLILDPYYKFFPDEDTSLKNPRPFFDFWQEQIEIRNLSVLFVHHDAKIQEGKIGGQKALGTTFINASVDGSWSVERVLDANLDPIEFLRIARLSFESRNWLPIRPLDIKMNDHAAFEIATLPKGSVDDWDIAEAIKNNGGSIGQKDLVKQFKSSKMFFDAKERGLNRDPPLFYEDKQKKQGNPVILTLIKGGQGDL